MGIDATRLVDPVPNYLICSICMDVLLDPTEICPSAHVFCFACYQQSLGGGQPTCPTCRQVCYQVRPALTIRRIIDGLHVRCYYNESGCQWTGPWGNRHDHRKNCDYVKRGCPNQGCDFFGTAAEVKRHLRKYCEEQEVECPRGCGANYLRGDSAEHGAECTRWPCRAWKKCPTRLTLDNRDDHEEFCLRILTGTRELRKEHNDEVKKREAAEQEVEALKKEVLQLKAAAIGAKKAAAIAKAVSTAGKKGGEAKANNEVAASPAQPSPSNPASPTDDSKPLGKRVSKPSARALEAATTANSTPLPGRRTRSRTAVEAEASPVAKRVKTGSSSGGQGV